ncbi:MAG: hypothetical protein JWM33_1830 [Caulobacteraceae bacterium]|nr:hypothetical protein [Caulobacteraceae bacterium]
MSLMFQPFKKYADFEGRARRKEYWLFYLFYMLVVVGFLIGTGVLTGLSMALADDAARGGGILLTILTVGFVLFCLASLIPQIAVGVRRLHDTNRSGWWMLISLVPFGGIVLLVFFVMEGTRGANRFGPDPITGAGVSETFA